MVIGLIVFFATRYTRKRKALSKSFATTVEHDGTSGTYGSINFTDVKKTEISNGKAPLLNLQETEAQNSPIFSGNQQQNDDSDDDVRNDYDDEVNRDMTGPLRAPSENDETDTLGSRSQLFDDEPTL